MAAVSHSLCLPWTSLISPVIPKTHFWVKDCDRTSVCTWQIITSKSCLFDKRNNERIFLFLVLKQNEGFKQHNVHHNIQSCNFSLFLKIPHQKRKTSPQAMNFCQGLFVIFCNQNRTRVILVGLGSIPLKVFECEYE